MNIFDTINHLVDQAGVTFRGAVVLVAAIIFVVVASKSRWAVATTLVSAIMAGAVIFLAAGGLEWVSTLVGGTVRDAG